MTKLDSHCPLSVRVDALVKSVFPPPSLKFRTAGFPQYGFKSDLGYNLRRRAHTRRLICGQKSRLCAPVALSGICSGVSALTVRSRGPWLASGLFCPARSSLTTASSEALGSSGRFMSYPAGLCPDESGRESRDSP